MAETAAASAAQHRQQQHRAPSPPPPASISSALWSGAGSLDAWLSVRTPVFGLRRWVLLGAAVGLAVVVLLFLFSFCICRRRRSRSRPLIAPPSSKPLKREPSLPVTNTTSDIGPPPRPAPRPELQQQLQKQQRPALADLLTVPAPPAPTRPANILEKTSDPEETAPTTKTGAAAQAEARVGAAAQPEASALGWGQWYTLKELEEATGGLAAENLIGEGGYGLVYRGVLADGSIVAVKNLFNNRGQAEREFKVEVEAIGRVRHKNLVRLLGYCIDGAHRMLVYEYVDNGNLEQWLHGDVGAMSPLTWEIRMSIILGTAKGLAYLHEGLEPKVVHRDVKSSNILLDRQWSPKVSDFGLAKVLHSERSHVTTRVMGTFGYVAPEYASTGLLNERSDVYSFGILIMEIITGRSPVDYRRPPDEVNLVDWLKNMVAERRSEELADPKLPVRPSPKALKRALLLALRCVDPDSQKRPKMGHVIHMLETDELLLGSECKLVEDVTSYRCTDHYDDDAKAPETSRRPPPYHETRWR